MQTHELPGLLQRHATAIIAGCLRGTRNPNAKRLIRATKNGYSQGDKSTAYEAATQAAANVAHQTRVNIGGRNLAWPV